MVALGASAGGLAALQRFLDHVPADSGMAFLIITHQAAERSSLLPELLAKHARVPVISAEDGMPLRPNQVYVAPPGNSLIVRGEALSLLALDGLAVGELAIDHAFRALARNAGERASAIVLSGSGSDGALGVCEIKSAFGLVMAQDPKSAQYPSMPASAIATQLVDYVLPPERMPAQLLRYHRGKHAASAPRDRLSDPAVVSALNRILSILRGRTGSDFSAYKKSTIRRRIERRMHVHGMEEPDDYARFLEHTAYEVDLLFKELLISVTSFFRDPEAYQVLEHELARLVEQKHDGEALRIWISGCATGEEAYTIAIITKDVLEQSGKDLKVQIFATDLDQQAIDIARSGRYPDGVAADIPAERLKRYFTRHDGGYRVNKDVRELIVFAAQNLIRDPPFTKLDLLSCRNLMIYLESELQRRVLGVFSYSLRPLGLLLLGTSESVTGFDDRFATLDKHWKVFQRLSSSGQPLPEIIGDRPAPSSGGAGHPMARDAHRGTRGIAALAERVLLSTLVPATILINEHGELIFVQGRVGSYFEPASGEPTQNVFSMAREGLRAELPALIRRAATGAGPVVRHGVQVKTNDGFHAITLSARRLSEPEAFRGAFVVSFEPAAVPEEKLKRSRKPARSNEGLSALEEELQRTRENLQGMIEELETSNEELKSTNEELQSTNEELQSANEELETSREEMQSLNEELQTVNLELEERNRTLSQTNDDMQNLLNSTEVATVFLDDQLRIKRFTKQAKKVFSLIETDVGRPLSDLAANLRFDGLLTEAHEVLSTLVFHEREVQTKEGSWRLMRILPYRTHDNLIDGLVMTFVDIDRLKRAQRSEENLRAHTDELSDALSFGLLVIDTDQQIVSANRALGEALGLDASRLAGRRIDSVSVLVSELPGLNDSIEQLQTDLKELGTRSLGRIRSATHSRDILVSAKRLSTYVHRAAYVLLVFEPV